MALGLARHPDGRRIGSARSCETFGFAMANDFTTREVVLGVCRKRRGVTISSRLSGMGLPQTCDRGVWHSARGDTVVEIG
jgi:hypothetical protein